MLPARDHFRENEAVPGEQAYLQAKLTVQQVRKTDDLVIEEAGFQNYLINGASVVQCSGLLYKAFAVEVPFWILSFIPLLTSCHSALHEYRLSSGTQVR